MSLLMLSLLTPAHAADLLVPIPTITGDAVAELADGSTLEGRVKSATVLMGSVRKLTLKTDDGAKHKLTAAEIDTLKVAPGGLAKMAAAADASSSLTEASRSNTSEVWSRDHVLYQQRVLPNGKTALLQLLNPGFDHLLEVYQDPTAQETAKIGVGGVTVAGGADKSYLVVRNGEQQAVKVSKKKYDTQASELFGDCATFTVPADPRFPDFADHVKAYDDACAIQGPMPQPEPVSSLPPTTGAPAEDADDEASEGDEAATGGDEG